MASCDYCGSSILFGGKKEGDLRFCNARCLNAGVLLSVSQQIPENVVRQRVSQVHHGSCPICGGQGPVDVHMSHRVMSFIAMTSWSSRPRMSCRSCGVKGQLGATAISALLGWWGVPWGLVLTPVQIIRNVIGMLRGPDPTQPSPQLDKLVRMEIAAQSMVEPRDVETVTPEDGPSPSNAGVPREKSGIKSRT